MLRCERVLGTSNTLLKQLGQPCQLNKGVGQDYVTFNCNGRADEKNTSERHRGLTIQTQKMLQVPVKKTILRVSKQQGSIVFIFYEEHKNDFNALSQKYATYVQ